MMIKLHKSEVKLFEAHKKNAMHVFSMIRNPLKFYLYTKDTFQSISVTTKRSEIFKVSSLTAIKSFFFKYRYDKF